MSTPEQVANPFGAVQTVDAGPSAGALAKREESSIQASLVIAKNFPRSPRDAMDRILTSCTRPGLAERAIYQYARGGTDIAGPSIRLAEELARQWGNLNAGIMEVSRGEGVSECVAYCWDLENNYRDEKRFQVRHWRDTKTGGYPLKDERDIYEAIANNGARRKRACILAVIPGDVVDAAVEQCEKTLVTKVDVTPERVAAMIQKFGEYGITKGHIEQRIQRHVDAISPALFVQLGRIYNSLRDGMSTPTEWFEIESAPAASNGDGRGSVSLTSITKKGEASPAADQAPPNDPQPKCDGNHGAPVCADPECWQREEETVDPDDIRTAIKAAKSADQLDEAMDLIRSLPEGDERNSLKKAAMEKLREIVG